MQRLARAIAQSPASAGLLFAHLVGIVQVRRRLQGSRYDCVA